MNAQEVQDLMSELPGVDITDPQVAAGCADMAAQAAMADQANSGFLVCEQCDKPVPVANMVLHEAHCTPVARQQQDDDANLQAALALSMQNAAPAEKALKNDAAPRAPVATYRAKLTGAEPEEVAKIAEATASAQIRSILDQLTGAGKVRGCMVNSSRPYLQALHEVLQWTIGGYDTRPTAESSALKDTDRHEVLIGYRQELPFPQVAMYEYLCATLFNVPMRPVGPEVPIQLYIDTQGATVPSQWKQADWGAFDRSSTPPCKFARNRYPYQLKPVGGPEAHEFQRSAQHWILWYFHLHNEPLANPTDDEIDAAVRREVTATALGAGFENVDFIWYRNPFMSVPDMFHVQVFWVVPE